MVFIHKLMNTTSGSGNKISLGTKQHRVAKNHKRILGSGLQTAIYEGGKLQKKGDLLRNLKLAQPKLPKKYISFET